MRFSSAPFFRLLLAFRFRLRGHAEELHVVKCPEIGARREQNLRLRDVCGRLEILLLLYGFRGECGAERPERTRIHDAPLRAKAVQHRTEFVEDSCHIGLSYRRILRHNLTKFVEAYTLLLADWAGYIHH